MKTIEAGMDRGAIFEIERFALNDGPGIRTVVFLKGCPLSCWWCCNPESQTRNPQLVYWKNKCIGCGRCLEVCPKNALTPCPDGIAIHWEACEVCGRCAKECGAEALTVLGKRMTPGEVLEEVIKDRGYFGESGGGVTFSGGEVLFNPVFLTELLRVCKGAGLHTCIETTGYTQWRVLEEMLPLVDLFLYDLKLMDPALHQKLIGVDPALIHQNFIRLLTKGAKVIVRIPIIPGITDTSENIASIITFLQKNAPGIQVDLLPYHRLGVSKYDRLKREYRLIGLEPPSGKSMDEIMERFVQGGFAVRLGG